MSQVAFITGGSRGVGRAMVDYFVQHGWQVATCATSEKNLQQSSAHLKLACDVSEVQQVKQTIQKITDVYPQIDVLINSAGIAGENPMTPDSDDTKWHEVVDVNLHGTYYLSKYLLPYLPDGKGRIINIASILGLKGVPDHIAYCVAKHAVVGLTRSLALYLAPRRITVNAICPGWIDTDMAHERFTELQLTPAQIEAGIPLGKIITPFEVAQTAYFLATSAGAKITGQTIIIDGGAIL